MTPSPWSALRPVDRTLLRFGRLLVPAAEREEWLRYWHAELCFMRSRGPLCGKHSLTPGLIRDAVWLRSENWRRNNADTATVCLALLAILLFVTAIPAFLLAGSLEAFAATLVFWVPSFTLGSSMVVMVGHFTSASPVEMRALPLQSRIKAGVFYAGKIALLLPLTFFLSADLSAPLHPTTSFPAFLLQSLLFAVLALIGLQWAIQDGNVRCKYCLRPLAEPVRVGRPSHNFLEWSGTELLCIEGHGLLSIPEIESSFCRSSRWFPGNLAQPGPHP